MNQLEAPAWRATSMPAVDPARFGRDHWSTLAYIETRTVDNKGLINHDGMRCDPQRHPIMMQAKGRALLAGLRASGAGYPTILAGGDALHDHDDYDCLDDLIAAGLLEVHMPELAKGVHVEQYYVDAHDRPITDVDGTLIEPGSLTGMAELRLCAYARFSLTERGREVASALRAHRAYGGNCGTFRME